MGAFFSQRTHSHLWVALRRDIAALAYSLQDAFRVFYHCSVLKPPSIPHLHGSPPSSWKWPMRNARCAMHGDGFAHPIMEHLGVCFPVRLPSVGLAETAPPKGWRDPGSSKPTAHWGTRTSSRATASGYGFPIATRRTLEPRIFAQAYEYVDRIQERASPEHPNPRLPTAVPPLISLADHICRHHQHEEVTIFFPLIRVANLLRSSQHLLQQ